MRCDMLPTEAPGPHYQGDVRDVIESVRMTGGMGFDLMVAHPPCTRLTNSGVRWLHVPPPGKTIDEMLADLDKAAEFYRMLRDAPIAKKAIENPVMHRYARERIIPGARSDCRHWCRRTSRLPRHQGPTNTSNGRKCIECRPDLTAGRTAAAPISALLQLWRSSGAK